MSKRIVLAAFILLVGFTVMACDLFGTTTTPTTTTTSTTTTTTTGTTSDTTTTTTTGTTTTTTTTTATTAPALTSITFAGATDITLAFDAPFNIFTGVTATGNDGVDYTSQITYQTTSQSIGVDGTLNTKTVGVHAIRYIVTVGTLVATRWRYITVEEPEGVEGQMLVNPDFALGTAGWDSPAVIYIADGAAMTLSEDAGTLKVEVVSGANPYTPRFGQMSVPFELGKTYEISFDAKSSAAKTINLQVGELLSGAPYFTDFKTGLTIHKAIGTDWATYSYKFTMTQENDRGGLLFELGTVDGLDIDATMWFDNIVIEESTPDVDTIAPVLTGVKTDVELAVNAEFDPTKGVTAFDATDGDVTASIVITFEDENGNAISSINTGVPGTYFVIYTVEDELGNLAEAVTEVVVKSLNFSEENLVLNPSFDDELNVETPEWKVWSQDWGTAPVVTAGIDTTSGVFNLGTVGGGDAAWAVQLQSALVPLVQGETYRVQFTASASVARSINVAVGWSTPAPESAYTQFGRRDAIAISTEPGVYEFIFTVAPDSHDAMITFELGSQPGYADGVFTIYDAAINLAVPEESGNYYSSNNFVANPSFNAELNLETPEWKVWSQNWGTAPVVTAGIDTVNGVYNVGITGGGDAAWAVQVQSGLMYLEQGKTYRILYTASASVARNINIAVGWSSPENVYTQFGRQNGIAVTTEPELYEFVFTVEGESHDAMITFELGSMEGFADGVFTLYDVTLNQAVEFSDQSLVVNGNFNDPLNETTPEWKVWSQNWGGAPVVIAAINNVTGVYNVDITGGGDAAWAVQVQSGLMYLEHGQTYRILYTASASVARNINIAVGWSSPENVYTQFARQNGIAITTESTLYEFVFTVEGESHDAMITFELGSMEGFADGVFTLHDVALNETVDFQTVNLISNGNFNDPLNEVTPEWHIWSQNWGTMPVVVGAIDTLNGVYTVDITNGGGDAAWAVQMQSAFVLLEQGVTYRLKVTMSASVARTVNMAVGWTNTENNAWTEFARLNNIELTDDLATFTIIFTAAPETHNVILAIEMGATEGFAEGIVTVYDATLNAAIVPVVVPVE